MPYRDQQRQYLRSSLEGKEKRGRLWTSYVPLADVERLSGCGAVEQDGGTLGNLHDVTL